MFIVEAEKQLFSLKPMNCPESTFIYRSHLRSYRDLPLRFNEYGRLHRNERSGTLSGLTRVRQFIQDDAHLYVRPDQLTDEIQALLGEVREAYGWFGLEPRFAFATKPDKALGDPALWERAEQLIREAFAAADITYDLKPKDGTFYAPKIDIYIDDALGREWQMATIQVDLVMLPERFDLTYIDETGQPQRPMAIHRAIYGSLERFIGILIEHFAGAFPLWIAPVQAVVIPIADRHIDGARELAEVLRGRGPARRGRRLVQPDAVQDPRGPGTKGPVHAGPGRPGDRGPPGDRARARGGQGRGPGDGRLGRAGGPACDGVGGPRRRVGRGPAPTTAPSNDRAKRFVRPFGHLTIEPTDGDRDQAVRPPVRSSGGRCRRGRGADARIMIGLVWRAIVLSSALGRAWPYRRAPVSQSQQRQGVNHQPRPASQPDDPDPSGPGGR